jgi:glycine/D-amino acid oxidase-like deaminating enzyme
LLGVYPPLKRDITCDVVVLGGGISGAFVAETLAREGLHVVVLDKREIGGGSTSASTALLQYEIDTPLVELSKKIGRRDAEQSYRLCHDSINSIERLVEDLKVECVFQRRKSVYLATRSSDAEMLRQEAPPAGHWHRCWWDEGVASRFVFVQPRCRRRRNSTAIVSAYPAARHERRVRFDRTLMEQYDAAATACA